MELGKESSDTQTTEFLKALSAILGGLGSGGHLCDVFENTFIRA